MTAVIAVCAQGGGKPMTGNPTPGTAQPEPPDLAKRVTFSGCVRSEPRASGAPAAGTTDPSEVSSARFVLNNAVRVNRVPSGTGASVPSTGPASRTYRLEGIDAQLAPFVGTKVEVSGQINSSPSAARGAKSTVPTLHVEFLEKIAASCQ
jgi:hypothetical protein